MQLPRAAKAWYSGMKSAVRWDPGGTGLRKLGRALPEPGELGEGHLGFLQHDRRAWKGSKRWARGKAPSTSVSGGQDHLIMKQGEEPKEIAVCRGEGKVHLSVRIRQQVRQN